MVHALILSAISQLLGSKSAEAPPVKSTSASNATFSSIFAAELHSLSHIPGPAVVSASTKELSADESKPTKSSFDELFPNVAVAAVRNASYNNVGQPAAKAGKAVPGIMYLPIPKVATPAPEAAGQQNKPNQIDIARIVNFKRPGPQIAKSASQGTTIASLVSNTRVTISRRGQVPVDGWERYRMESQAQKGGALSDGILVNMKICV